MSTLSRTISTAAIALACLFTGAARAESIAKITKVHMCCEGCVTALEKAVTKVEGVSQVEVTEKEGTVVITASDDKTLQKAVNAVAKAGFHGKIDNKAVKFRAVKVPEGKVQSLELVGVHNCCGACTKAIQAALGKVEGVKGDTLKPKARKFTIEGDFVAKDAIKAIEAAGFHAHPPKPKKAAS